MTFSTNYFKMLLQITEPFLQTTTESYYYAFITNFGQKIIQITTKIY